MALVKSEKYGITANVTQDVITGRFDAMLYGGEFPNCHGSGDTEDAAFASLKLLVNLKRRKRDQGEGHDHRKAV